MRIAHITPFYHPIIGGVEEVVKRITEHLAKKGNEVYVITYNRLRKGGKGTLPRQEEINGVNVIRLKPDITWSHGTYSRELPKAIEKLKPDIVHVHVWRHPHVFQIAKLKKKLGYKTILHTHAPFYRLRQVGITVWTYHKIVDRLFKSTLKAFDIVIALTPYEKDILLERLDIPKEKVKVIPNGIDDKVVHIAKEITSIHSEQSILYLGRISRDKNIDLLLKAMKYVTKKTNIPLVMAGPDEGLIDKYKKYAKKHNIDLHYKGKVSEKEKYKLYARCTIFTHPALYEGFCITLLEAQAFGKPCIVTGKGGQLYTAPPGKTSLHAKPSPKDYAQAILRLLSDEELYKKLSTNAREWVIQFTWTKILPKYEEVYNQLINKL